MKKFIKRLFCLHLNYIPQEPNNRFGKLYIWKCKRCKKTILRDYDNNPINYKENE